MTSDILLCPPSSAQACSKPWENLAFQLLQLRFLLAGCPEQCLLLVHQHLKMIDGSHILCDQVTLADVRLLYLGKWSRRFSVHALKI